MPATAHPPLTAQDRAEDVAIARSTLHLHLRANRRIRILRLSPGKSLRVTLRMPIPGDAPNTYIIKMAYDDGAPWSPTVREIEALARAVQNDAFGYATSLTWEELERFFDEANVELEARLKALEAKTAAEPEHSRRRKS